jgi:hypothetical protein
MSYMIQLDDGYNSGTLDDFEDVYFPDEWDEDEDEDDCE